MPIPDPAPVPTLLVATKVAVLSLGSLVTFLTYRAFRRTDNRSLGALAAGFASISLGCALGGGLDELLGLGLRTALLLQGVFTLGGFAIITRSLYAETSLGDDRRSGPGRSASP